MSDQEPSKETSPSLGSVEIEVVNVFTRRGKHLVTLKLSHGSQKTGELTLERGDRIAVSVRGDEVTG